MRKQAVKEELSLYPPYPIEIILQTLFTVYKGGKNPNKQQAPAVLSITATRSHMSLRELLGAVYKEAY